MQETKIYSRNSTFQKFQVLKTNRNKRYRYHEFLVEGVRSLNEAVKNNWEIHSFLYDRANLSDWAKDMIRTTHTEMNYCLTGELMRELSGKEDTSELMAVVNMRRGGAGEFRLPEDPLLVLFDRPSNRGNLGTLLRSCDGLGADGLILTGHGVDLYDPEVVTASMGSFFRVQAAQMERRDVTAYIEELRASYPGFRTVGTTAHRQRAVWGEDLSGPVMLMLGNETDGLSYGFKQGCDVLCTIPMAEEGSASSFNVACAGTVLMYEAVRQRAKRG